MAGEGGVVRMVAVRVVTQREEQLGLKRQLKRRKVGSEARSIVRMSWAFEFSRVLDNEH